jgi:UDP-galactopyranose mutase
MLSHPNIKVMLNTDYREIVHLPLVAHDLHRADRRVLRLPLRQAALSQPGVRPSRLHAAALPAGRHVVNYPNDYAYTRCTEFKYLTGQQHRRRAIVHEYPRAEGDPYYPVPRAENQALYAVPGRSPIN